MSEFMWEQVRSKQTLVGVGESVCGHPIIAALMMFLAQSHDVIAQRQQEVVFAIMMRLVQCLPFLDEMLVVFNDCRRYVENLSLIHISEPTRRTPISYAVFCLKKKKTK